MDKQQPISYTFDDIKRYREGLMSREEMHAFEQASMEDPFLSDALEGYMSADMNLADRHLEAISQKVQAGEQEKEQAVVVSMPTRGFAMWRVAAMVIVIAGAGLITYNILKQSPDADGTGPVASVPKETAPAATTPAAAQPTDTHRATKPVTNLPETNQAVAVNPAPARDQPVAAAPTAALKQKEQQQQERKETTAKADIVIPPAETETKDAEVQVRSEEKRSAAVSASTSGYNQNMVNNQFRGRILMPDNKPAAYVSLNVQNNATAVRTNKKGFFNFSAGDTVVNATIASGAYANTRVQLRANTDNNINLGTIRMSEDSSFERTVAVVTLGSKKEKVSSTAVNNPIGGWQSFQDYVTRQLGIESDSTANDDTFSNNAQVEFVTDNKGNPGQIKVTNIADELQKQRIIDAILKGPRWTNSNTTTRLLIRY